MIRMELLFFVVDDEGRLVPSSETRQGLNWARGTHFGGTVLADGRVILKRIPTMAEGILAGDFADDDWEIVPAEEHENGEE